MGETIDIREKNKIIKKIKSKKIYYCDIPYKYRDDIEIINAQRLAGMRETVEKGFDILRQKFFVKEHINSRFRFVNSDLNTIYFDDFSSYYDYLNGDIYENACYYQWDYPKDNPKLDYQKMKTLRNKKSLIDYTIDDCGIETVYNKDEYYVGEKVKKNIKKWVEKINSCDTVVGLEKVLKNLEKSTIPISRDFFIWQYAWQDINDRNRFETIIKLLLTVCDLDMIKSLCFVYKPEEILELFNYSSIDTYWAKSTFNAKKSELRRFIRSLDNPGKEYCFNAYFDENSHYYCVHYRYTDKSSSFEQEVFRYFEVFEDLAKFLEGDLRYTDLSNVLDLEADFSLYKMDDTTKLPINNKTPFDYVIEKKFKDKSNSFCVIQYWYNPFNKKLVSEKENSFEHFFDFVAFLKGDLSNADLIMCDDLARLRDVQGINFTGAKICSTVCEQIGLKTKENQYPLKPDLLSSFSLIEDNEESTKLVLSSRQELLNLDFDDRKRKEILYYITDIHLLHKLKKQTVRNSSDIDYYLRKYACKLIEGLNEEYGNDILLIGGDISSDYDLFKKFVKYLSGECKRRYRKPYIIFTLGNHELWEFSGKSFEKIVEEYNEYISQYENMFLVQNDIVFSTSKENSGIFERKINKISEKDILVLDEGALRDRLREARLIIFGGLGFSGYNNDFNALNGIYRNTVDRTTEIIESQKFEKLYRKVEKTLSDKHIVIFTHMPIDCWCQNPDYHKNYVYISGHTHKNVFYDDGQIRVYADNQSGYSEKNIYLKWIDLDNEYDFFADYQDGIYEITKKDYQSFYRGKNLYLNFNRNVNVLYMLKKNRYYCFIHKSPNGNLTILNGGALKSLDISDISYYYDFMDIEISMIKSPLDKYYNVQKTISNEIKKVGGYGTIHGCIIDIDDYNHIYVNPVDGKITPYWASDIINKCVYPNVPALLKAECKELYNNYKKLLKDSSKDIPALFVGNDTDLEVLPQEYLNTDIYKASREIKKMQKLYSNVLTTWIDVENRDYIKRMEKQSEQ